MCWEGFRHCSPSIIYFVAMLYALVCFEFWVLSLFVYLFISFLAVKFGFVVVDGGGFLLWIPHIKLVYLYPCTRSGARTDPKIDFYFTFLNFCSIEIFFFVFFCFRERSTQQRNSPVNSRKSFSNLHNLEDIAVKLGNATQQSAIPSPLLHELYHTK